MNRTEHEIRMAFEPNYAEKHKEFVEERNKIVKRNIGLFSRSWLPALAGPTFLVIFHCVIRPEIMKQLLSFYLLILLPFIMVPVFLTASDIKRLKAAFYL
jgi:hypothetical protein